MQADSLSSILNSPFASATLGLTILAVVALAMHLVARPFVLRMTRQLVQRTRTDLDGVFYDARVPHRLSLIIPLIALQIGIDWVPALPPEVHGFIVRMLAAMTILVVALTVAALLTAAHEIYLRTPAAEARPIKSYVQLVKVVVYSVAAIFIVARLADQSPWFFVSGLGAMMAVILLIFRDTILSLVASVQLTNNDLIRVGDWIEMPQFGADGDVTDIALNAVSVENWDKTITVIPTHKFLEHSFKNWRNMYGVGRRIKRSIFINVSSIRFLTGEEIERLRRFVLLKDYIDRKLMELEESNAQYQGLPGAVVNQRRLTNMGTFRAYVDAYLRNHPMIDTELTFLVRQLAPTPEGLPLEIYVFTKDTRWAAYEGIQADVFDHIFAIIPEFGLTVYQRPSSHDFTAMIDEGAPLRIVATPSPA